MPFCGVHIKLNLKFLIFSTAEALGKIMELILFNMTSTCTIAIAFNLYVLEFNGQFIMQIMVAIIDLVIILWLTFAHFYLSERITCDLLEAGDCFYNSPWYRLKINQQKLLVIPIQRAQQEVRLKGLGIFECSLAGFLSVVVGIVSAHIEVNVAL